MPWFYVDDGFSDSKPVMNLPERYRLAACGLWVLAGSWSAKEETDGFVPESKLRQLGATPGLVTALTTSATPLWQQLDNNSTITRHKLGNISFNGWDKWQPTRKEIAEKRAAAARRQRDHRRKGRTHVTSVDSEKSRVTDGVTDTDSNGVTDAGQEDDSNALVTRDPHARAPRPDPTLIGNSPLGAEVESVGGCREEEIPTPRERGQNPRALGTNPRAVGTNPRANPNRTRGTRLSPGWTPPADVIAQMRADHPHVDLKAEHAKFVDYWISKAGKDAIKVNWVATWRNWIRRAAESPIYQRRHPSGPTQSTGDRRFADIQALKTQPPQQKRIES